MVLALAAFFALLAFTSKLQSDSEFRDETLARRYIEAGSLFTAVGVDAAILVRGCDHLAARFAGV